MAAGARPTPYMVAGPLRTAGTPSAIRSSYGPSHAEFAVSGHPWGVTQTVGRRRNSLASVTVALGAVAALLLLKFAAVSNPRGQRLDEAAMNTVFGGSMTLEQLQSILGQVTVGTTAFALLCCVILALVRGRFQAAIGAVVLVAGANITTQLLKRVVFDRPDFGLQSLNSFPSGHTTVTIASVLAAVLVAPAALRAIVIVLGSFAATLVGASTLVGDWHRPSDVIGALLVALAWAAVIALILGVTHEPRTDGFLVSSLLGLAGAAVAGLVLIAVGVRSTGPMVETAIVLGVIGAATALTVGTYARLVPR